MQESPWFMGVDLGTGSCKCVVTDGKGKVLGFGAVPYEGADSQEWQEQDPNALLTAAAVSVRTAVEKAGQDPKGCAGLSMGGALHSVLALDDRDEPLTGVITWADGRALQQSRTVKNTSMATRLYKETGCPVHGMYPLYKIIWLREMRPEVFKAARRFVSAKEYVLSQWTGRFLVDYSLASGSGLLDIHKHQWSDPALDLAGVRETQLSPISPPTALQGWLKRGVARHLGIPETTPVVIGSSDAANSSIGAGAVLPSQATCMVGTSGALRVIFTRPLLDEKAHTWCYAIDEKHWLVGGAINNGGIALSWLKDLLNQALMHRSSERLSFDDLIHLASEAPAGAGGMLCLPFLAGERSPNWNLNARAVFAGMTIEHDARHLSRSLLEGIAFRIRSLRDMLEEAGLEIKQILASGGFTKSRFWVQVVTDALNRDLHVPSCGETSALGAAFWAMSGTGHLESFEGIRDMVEPGITFHPNAADAAVYDRTYPLYDKIYHALADEGIFDRLASLEVDP